MSFSQTVRSIEIDICGMRLFKQRLWNAIEGGNIIVVVVVFTFVVGEVLVKIIM